MHGDVQAITVGILKIQEFTFNTARFQGGQATISSYAILSVHNRRIDLQVV